MHIETLGDVFLLHPCSGEATDLVYTPTLVLRKRLFDRHFRRTFAPFQIGRMDVIHVAVFEGKVRQLMRVVYEVFGHHSVYVPVDLHTIKAEGLVHFIILVPERWPDIIFNLPT